MRWIQPGADVDGPLGGAGIADPFADSPGHLSPFTVDVGCRGKRRQTRLELRHDPFSGAERETRA